MATSQICPKLCMHVEKDYTNKFPKFKAHKLYGTRDIYIQKCSFRRLHLLVIHSKHSTDLWCSLYLASDWPVAVCYCNCGRKIGLSVDDDWQVVVNSSSSQCIQSVIGQLHVFSLVLTSDIISVGVWKYLG